MPSQLKAAELHEKTDDRKYRSASSLRPLEGRNGFVFALVAVAGRLPDAEAPAALVLERMDRLADTFGAEANAQHRFEQFLSALNETIAERVGAGAWAVPIQSFNALVGIACDGQMFLSGTGDLTALFLHRTREQRYQVFNLFRGIQTEQALPTWEKTFAVVLDGTLEAGDVFCVSNRELSRHVAAEELNSILSTLPPKSAAAKLRQYFPAETDLSIIVVQAPDGNEPAVETAKQLASVSLDHLARTQTETGVLLEDQKPRPLAGLRQQIRKVGLKPNFSGVGRSLWRLAFSSVRACLHMLLDGARWTGRTTVSLTKKETRSQLATAVRVGTDRRARALLGRFVRLPKTTKTLLLGAVGILAVLSIGITVLNRSQAHSAELAAYKEQTDKVEQAIDKADGAVIYKDENQARTLYAEATALVDALPTDTDERAAAASGYRAQIEGAMNELRHLVTIPSPTLLGDLGEASGISGRAILSSGGGVYVLGSDKKLHLLDASQRAFVTVDTADGEIGVPSEVTTNGSTAYVLDDRPELGRIDLEQKLIQLTNVKPTANARWADLAFYNGKLYVLEPSSGQIIKYNPAGGDFDGGTNWIRARSTDLSDAVSLSIDATVFVLKRGGRIVRFVGGSEVGWSQGVADPPVTGASDIWTSVDSAYVYVLDPATQRLIVYAKEGGALVTQYRSDAFTGLTDFLVDEPNKTIYFLAGSKLYSITASHLGSH